MSQGGIHKDITWESHPVSRPENVDQVFKSSDTNMSGEVEVARDLSGFLWDGFARKTSEHSAVCTIDHLQRVYIGVIMIILVIEGISVREEPSGEL